MARLSCPYHHHDAKRSAVASCRCDLSPKRAIFCQLLSVGHWYSRVLADLMDPSDRRSTTSAFPIRGWSGTVLCFTASPKDLVCWNVLCESGHNDGHVARLPKLPLVAGKIPQWFTCLQTVTHQYNKAGPGVHWCYQRRFQLSPTATY